MFLCAVCVLLCVCAFCVLLCACRVCVFVRVVVCLFVCSCGRGDEIGIGMFVFVVVEL